MRVSGALAAVLLLASAGAARAADAPFAPPAANTVPPGPLGDAIRLGRKTAEQFSAGLSCTSCHLQGARTPNAAPWVGLWGVYPEYEARSGRAITLADRINECFRRSMNGKPLPLDSFAMRGLLAFIWWLSMDVPTGVSVTGRGFKSIEAPRPADPVKGGTLYIEKCAACHGASGQGVTGAGGRWCSRRSGGRAPLTSAPAWPASTRPRPS